MDTQLVRFNVGGREFTVSRATLRCEAGYPACNVQNLLALIVSHDDGSSGGGGSSSKEESSSKESRRENGATYRVSTGTATRDASGAIFIDRDGEGFAVVLNFLRTGSILAPRDMNMDLVRSEFDFFQVLAPGVGFDDLLHADDDARFQVRCRALLERDTDSVDELLVSLLRRCRQTLLLHLAAVAGDPQSATVAVHVDLAHQQEASGAPGLSDAEIQSAAPYGNSEFYVLYSRVSGVEHQLVCAHRARAAQIISDFVSSVGWRCRLTVGGTGWNRIRFHRESEPISPE